MLLIAGCLAAPELSAPLIHEKLAISIKAAGARKMMPLWLGPFLINGSLVVCLSEVLPATS